MTSVDDFIKEEETKMTWLEKFFMNYPKMYSTKELAGPTKGLLIDTEKTFRPSLFDKFIATLFLIFSILCWLILFNMLTKHILVPVTTGGIIFISSIIWILIWNTFLNRKYIYTIKLNKNHIEIDKKIIPWTEIVETQIMLRQAGRGRNSYLVIFTADDLVRKYSLFKFRISDKKLSTLIELYKTKNECTT
ncbi:MAG: hypothetical protein QM791_06670 [Ferruginibacter sp.]